jgi:hypothetical protein
MLCLIKGTKLASRFYPGGFTNETVVLGSRYDTNQVEEMVGSTLAVGGGNVLGEYHLPVSLVVSNSTAQPKGVGLPVGVNPITGAYMGTMVDPITGVTNKFRGVFLQKMRTGAGFTKGTNALGWSTLEARPLTPPEN